MNTIVGTSSLLAAFLSEPILVQTNEVTLTAAALAGTALLLREGVRAFGRPRGADTFSAYRDARRLAQGRIAA